MVITWFGQSCFLIESLSGEKILIDPFDKALGGSPYKGSVDIVTISHNHLDHNYTDELNPGYITLNSPVIFQSENVRIQGIQSFHDNLQGFKRGNNIIFIYELDNIRLCHLGDLGHMLTDDVIDLIGNIDILFIPIDYNFALDPELAYKLCLKIQSKIVIPMHYKTAAINYPGDGIERFIAFMKNAMNLNSSTLTIDKAPTCLNQVKIFKL